jgi:hypothetical protein
MSPATTSRVAGSSGPWPETNSMLPCRIACTIGGGLDVSVNPVVGADADWMICLGMGPCGGEKSCADYSKSTDTGAA